MINQIRNVLGDNADRPLYVETLPRRGYRFLAPVVSKTVAAPRPRVVESESSERIPIPLVIASAAGALAPAAKVTVPSNSPAVPRLEAEPVGEMRPRVRRVGLLWAVAAVALIGLVAGSLYWRAHRVHVLTEKDTIVIADFDNKTGDSVFDALRQALAIQLEASHFLTVLSDRKASETLKLMSRPSNTPITKDVADEICQRNGYKLVLGGSIASIGDHYLITLKATDCQTGEAIASAEAEAQNRNQVVKVLGQVGNQLRNKLGESRPSVEKFNTPLEKATTPSLEALEAFSQAQEVLSQPNRAIPFLKTAVELDPKFARAYASLGGAYKNLGDSVSSKENFNKAYELRDRVSLRERLKIEGDRYSFVTGQLEEAIQTYSQWAATFPDDPNPHAVLGGALYTALGRYDKAAAEIQERARLSGQPDYNLVGVYACLNRFDDAQALVDQAPLEVDNEFLRETRYTLAFVRGDTAVMQEKVSEAMGIPAAADRMLSAQSDTEAYYGRLAKARQLSEAAVQLAKRREVPEETAGWRADEALREVEMGNSALARQRAKEALALSTEPDVEVKAALALARAGDTARAQSLVAKLDHEFPLDTMMQCYWLATIKAAIELETQNSGEAIEILRSAMQYELGYTNPGIAAFGTLYPVYLRGQAYLQAGQARQAAVEFQKMIDHRGILGNLCSGLSRICSWRERSDGRQSMWRLLASPIRTSLPSGKTPIPTFRYTSNPKPSSPKFNSMHGFSEVEQFDLLLDTDQIVGWCITGNPELTGRQASGNLVV